MKSSSPLQIFCVGLLCLVGHVSAETVTFQDNFDCKPGEAGTPLDLRNIGTSQTAWEASSNLVMAEGNGLNVTDQNPFIGRVTLPSELKEVSVEADINPVPPASQAENPATWLSVGIGNAPLINPSFGGLFLLVRPGGTYSLMFNPESDDTRSSRAVALKSGRIQSWNPDGMNHVKIVYDKAADSVSAFANGDEPLVDGIVLQDKNISLDAAYAGFSGIWQSSEARGVGKFSATITK